MVVGRKKFFEKLYCKDISVVESGAHTRGMIGGKARQVTPQSSRH